MILNLRQHDELGSTFLGMLERYADNLRDHDSKLMLAEVGPRLYGQLPEDRQAADAQGPQRVPATPTQSGQSVIEALDAAEEWIEARDSDRTPQG